VQPEPRSGGVQCAAQKELGLGVDLAPAAEMTALVGAKELE